MAAHTMVSAYPIGLLPRTSAGADLREQMLPHLPGLRAHALSLCRNREQAEELLQNTVLRALRFESTFRGGSNLRAWLHQVLHSVFVGDYRRSRRERRALQRFGSDPCSWVYERSQEEPQSLSPRVQTALAELPDSFAQVVRAIDLNGLGYHETARAAGIPIGTVMSRLFRGRQRLRVALSEPEVTSQAA